MESRDNESDEGKKRFAQKIHSTEIDRDLTDKERELIKIVDYS